LYKEEQFEDNIEKDLINKNFTVLKSENFNKDAGLFENAIWAFLMNTQIDKIKRIEERKGSYTKSFIIDSLIKRIDNKGYLYVLRNGFQLDSVKFDCIYFKPSSNKNEDAVKKYNLNKFYVTRQLQYDKKHTNELDIVISVNGFPFATMELKNPMTGQNYKNAIEQYKKDRNPLELFFKPDHRALVHFAVDTNEVHMATVLKKEKTTFLPFNKGNDDGAGNPEVKDGYKTEYLWNEVLVQDNILELIRKFIFKKDDTLFFPRYHQWKVVRNLVDDVKENKVGKNYLVQHSAGSGKSNSIAWLAHNVAYTHDSDDNSIFDSVLVITDRKALDSQLRANIRQFENVDGVIAAAENGSWELAKALEQGKKIIITTIQKFQFALPKLQQLKGNRFAVIIDEAHSSQSGEAASKVRQTLSINKGETTMERIIESQGRTDNISYFAFTATPKPETIQVFGTKDEVTGESKAFHLYSMKQAIEEGFIHDVLRNYTPYNSFYNLKTVSEEAGLREINSKVAQRQIREFVESRESVIRQKSQIMIEHFETRVRHKIDGQAKAMVVTGGIEQAILFYKEFKKQLEGTGMEAIIAFSGDKEINGFTYTEENMNKFKDSQTPEEFKKPQYKFLIVADKYQTGFDQPLLHTMYVNKKLNGVNCVQTLSRLNRTHKGKTETFVLDFVNDIEDVQKSFEPFYKTNILKKDIDFNKVLDFKQDLDEYFVYDKQMLDRYWELLEESNVNNHQKIDSLVAKAYTNFEDLEETKDDEKEMFEKILWKYISGFNYITQIIKVSDPEYIKLYEFGKKLYAVILANKDIEKIDIKDSIELANYTLILKEETAIDLKDEDSFVEKDMGGIGGKDEEKILLNELIEIINLANSDIPRGEVEKINVYMGEIVTVLVNEKNKEMLRNNGIEEFRKELFENVKTVLHSSIEQHKKIDDMLNSSELFGEGFMKLIAKMAENKIKEES
jgi:type I restriction enzyme R subunit